MNNKTITASGVAVFCAHTHIWPTSRVLPHPDNPNSHPAEQVAMLAAVIQGNGWRNPIKVSQRSGFITAGHCRLLAAQKLGLSEVPIDYQHYETEADELKDLSADNLVAELAELDAKKLSDLLQRLPQEELVCAGSSQADLNALLDSLKKPAEKAEKEAARKKLAEKFGVAPFSVLDARRGEWQERKRAWLALGIKSEVGRKDNLLKFSKTVLANGKPAEAGEDDWSGTSIFDPTLTEILYKWFCPPGGRILDPFAGGSVRGVVAGYCGFHYTGIDLRPEQVAANAEQWATISASLAAAPAPVASVSAPEPAANPEPGVKEWQHGFALDGLKAVRAIFKAHDGDLCLGAFTAYKETAAAADAKDGQLRVWQDEAGKPVVAIVCREVKQNQSLKDFRDQPVGEMKPGDIHVKRMACLPGFETGLLSVLRDCLTAAKTGHKTLWVESWAEHPVEKAVMHQLGLRTAGTKIKASSEVTIIFTSGAGAEYPLKDAATLNRLRARFDREDIDKLAEAMARNGFVMADHYSSYNKGHSWSAAALRGYGGDPNFIIKPSEMSKKWKDENADKLAWEIQDTPLRAALPEVEPFIAAIPGKKHRVRFMRLTPNGGELLRHADITDPDCGTEPGQTMRIHIPIATNPDVRFTMWNLAGQRVAVNMAVGDVWYLDTRKPHTAGNFGTTERVHLVMDVEVCPELVELLGDDAPVVADILRAELSGPEPVLHRHTIPSASASAPAAPPAASPAPLRPFSDPELISPVVKVGDVWLKRDDLFECNGARGSKARAGLALLKKATGAVTAGNRESPMISRVSRVAEFVGIPCRCHVADSAEYSTEELDAQAHGGELVPHKIGFLTNLCAKAKEDATARGHTYVALGMESQEYVDITKRQVANIPPEVKRIVMAVGTGMGLSSVLLGLSEAGREDVRILGVVVGLDPEPYIEKWAPKNWRERVTLVKAEKDFRIPAEQTNWWGVELDSHYEAKAAPYVQPGDLFWLLAIRATATEGQQPKVAPRWICGDSQNAVALAGEQPPFDLVFSCPPYADLEVYSDDPRDLSAKAKASYADFIAAYSRIVSESCALLKPGRFACFVVGDIRDKEGNYRNFVSDTIAAFRAAGLHLYNEMILVTSCGSLAIRVGRQFSGFRKVGKTHQNVLVFIKGDASEVKGWPVPDFSLADSDFEAHPETEAAK